MENHGLRTTTLTGRVETGVEHGSVVLRDATGEQWQIGRRWGHLVGCTVQVVGHPRTDVMTTAQQGTLFSVELVEVIEGVPRDGDPQARHDV